MARAGRVNVARSRRFFIDIAKPDKALCSDCFRSIRGTDADRVTSCGPCWACERAIWQMIILKVQHEDTVAKERLAELCEHASDEAFGLAQLVRADIGVGTIGSKSLEKRFSVAVRSFRKCWESARHAAWINADWPDEPAKWRTLRVRLGERKKALSLGPQLLSDDPTLCKKVSIERIHRAAGLLAVVARQLRLEAEETRALLVRNWAADEYDLAEFHASNGVSSAGLATGWVAELFDLSTTERDVLVAERKKFLEAVRQRRKRSKTASVTKSQ